MSRSIILLSAVVFAGLWPSSASSDAPTKETIVQGTLNISADSCGFPVTVVPKQDVLHIFTFSDVRVILNGSYVATATGNGKNLNMNLSGQGTFNPETGVFVSTGGTILIEPGSLLYVHGPIVFDANGRTITSSSVTDVCAVLGDP
jgi:hypothetical protein